MSRWVVPQPAGGSRGLAAPSAEEPDTWLGRIVKYVPSEVVAAFTMIVTAFAAISVPNQGVRGGVALGLIGAGLVATIVWIALKSAKPVKVPHLVVGPLAFVGWAYPISGAVLGDFFVPLVAFLLQAVVILLSIFIAPKA
jgi:hypothetical protein